MERPEPTIYLRTIPVEGSPDLEGWMRRLRGKRGLTALDSAGGEPGNWSWIGWDPLDLGLPQRPTLSDLRGALERAPVLDGTQVPGPFHGGFLGALAYDLGVAGESQRLPADPWELPPIVGGLYVRFLVFDHQTATITLVLPREEDPEPWLRLASTPGEAHPAGPFHCPQLERLSAPEVHCQRIERAREEIAAGEYYQANLAHVFAGATTGDPLDLYLELRRVNPAPYMAYLRFEEGAILSASPELLVDVRGEDLVARPIKGTAPRDEDPAVDEELSARLLASEKDRAELAMIVDLLRNDLGRVATVGTVHVPEFPTLRSYAGVHHLMADVLAKLRTGQTSLDALAALFPGGSITGAPKLRSMEAIAELEGEGRGYFTGSAGFLDGEGNACFNILIRTLQWRPQPGGQGDQGEVRFHVGGGITWSSRAMEEDTETLVKGARLARALGHNLFARSSELGTASEDPKCPLVDGATQRTR